MTWDTAANGMHTYTPELYEALSLASKDLIASTDNVMHRNDGANLEPGVFAALVALRNDCYVEIHLPLPGAKDRKEWPVRLTIGGIALLAGLQAEHILHTVLPKREPDGTSTDVVSGGSS